jgi:hypothetical protein
MAPPKRLEWLNDPDGGSMTEAEWHASDDPEAMLRRLARLFRGPPLSSEPYIPSDRKLRLFACSVCRASAAHRRRTPDIDYLADLAERTADGESHLYASLGSAVSALEFAGNSLRWGFEGQEQSAAADRLRDIFGNPFPLVAPLSTPMGLYLPQLIIARLRPELPAWLAWDGGVVPRLALAAYESGDFSSTPIIADALEEAGCADAELLGHLRGPRPHVRGCWALDLLLAKE